MKIKCKRRFLTVVSRIYKNNGAKCLCIIFLLFNVLFWKSSEQKSAHLVTTCPASIPPFFHNTIEIKVLALNVWGMPEVLGSKDKTLRMKAIAELIAHSQYDVFLLTELWLKADHQIIQAGLPPGFFMTEVGDFSLPSCDGVISPWDCSGLAIVSRFPFVETEFIPFLETGDWRSTDGEFWAQKGAGRVRIEPSSGFICDVFVTHTCADGPTYTNKYYREKQTEQVAEKIKHSDADFVIFGGDLNTDPTYEEKAYNEIEKVLMNSCNKPSITNAEWLSPEKATYGNPHNSYTYKHGPVVYDYIWQRARQGNSIWTSFFDVPLLKTKKLDDLADNPVYVSLSDHEAVTATLVLWKPIAKI